MSQQGDHIFCELFLAKESATRFFHDKSSACRFFHDRSVCGTGVLCFSRSTFAELLRENRGIISCRCNHRESHRRNFPDQRWRQNSSRRDARVAVRSKGTTVSCELFLAKESASRFFHDKSSACPANAPGNDAW